MISVAMATCQGERWISTQLRSILEQLAPRDEIVVADASSTDRTLEIVRDLCGDRARIVEGIRRGSPPTTFEAALKICRGDRIFLSDQDDIWLQGKVDLCCRELDRTGALLLLHDAKVVDADGAILSESYLRARGRRDGFWHNLWKPSYLGCALSFPRELLDLALPFPVAVPMHDWWLGLLTEREGMLRTLPIPLILHRRHGSNASFGMGRSENSLVRRFVFRLRIWQQLNERIRSIDRITHPRNQRIWKSPSGFDT